MRDHTKIGVIFFIPAFIAVLLTSVAQSAESCLKCHGAMFNKEINRLFVHDPFRLMKCEICHDAELGWIIDKSNADLAKRIRWLVKRHLPAMEQWFDFSAEGLEKVLYVEASNGRKICRKKIVLPELEKLTLLPNDHKRPKITDLKILEVQLGIIPSATIVWKTDKVSSSLVRYGVQGSKGKEASLADNAELSRDHRVTLTDLLPNKLYAVQAVSKDIYGNENASNTLIISTEKNFSESEGESEQALEPANQEPSVSNELYQANNRYLVRIVADRPIKLAVGALPAIPLKMGDKQRAERPQDHIPLKGPIETHIYSCYGCHKDYNKIATHPVNVRPKPGMTIPKEYPTLPNGNISCMSCHANHAQDIEFRLFKSSKKALCIGCHKNMA